MGHMHSVAVPQTSLSLAAQRAHARIKQCLEALQKSAASRTTAAKRKAWDRWRGRVARLRGEDVAAKKLQARLRGYLVRKKQLLEKSKSEKKWLQRAVSLLKSLENRRHIYDSLEALLETRNVQIKVCTISHNE